MESFEAVYEELFPQVYRYLLVLCGDRDLAEELAQETFFQAIQHIDSFRGDCKLYVWPVSYTHLDVYKRQRLDRAAGRRHGPPPSAGDGGH